MSICALASARARDGALVPGRWDKEYFNEPSSQSFYCAARDRFPRELSNTRGLDWMRAAALLALLGIQNGKIDVMHQYLGLYHSLVTMDNLHDEKNWPKQTGIVEVEERRRLVSTIYRLKIPDSDCPTVLVNVYFGGLFLDCLGRCDPLSRIPVQGTLPK